jgi:hypothetical protein
VAGRRPRSESADPGAALPSGDLYALDPIVSVAAPDGPVGAGARDRSRVALTTVCSWFAESPVIAANPCIFVARPSFEEMLDLQALPAIPAKLSFCLPCRRSWVRVPSAACAKRAPGAGFSFLVLRDQDLRERSAFEAFFLDDVQLQVICEIGERAPPRADRNRDRRQLVFIDEA